LAGGRSEQVRRGLRKTGIDLLGDVAWGAHICQFYRSKEDLLHILLPYFRAGLENNEFCMWVASEPLDRTEAERAARDAIPGFDRYVERGQMEVIPHTEWYLEGGHFDPKRALDGWLGKHDQAVSRGYDGLRLTGNTFWLEENSWREFADYEEDVDGTLSKYRIIALCAYSLDKCGVSEVVDVVNAHRQVIIRRDGQWTLVECAERKRAEAKLRQTEERYRLVAENVEDGVWTTDMNLRLTYLSPSAKRVRGHDPAEELAQPLKKMLTPASLENAKRVFKEQLATENRPQQDRGRTWTLELETYHKDGSTIWVEEKVTFLRGPDGRPVGLLGVTRDITGRKRAEESLRDSEERFRSIYEKSPVGIALYDADGQLIHMNQAALRIFGMCDTSDPKVPPLFSEHVISDEKARRRLGRGKTVTYEGSYDFDQVRRIGAYTTTRSGVIHLEVVVTPLGAREDGSSTGYLVQTHDITARRLAEEAQHHLYQAERELRHKLEEEIKAKAEFTRALVHELKTPLTPVMAASSALVNVVGEGPVSELARSIVRGASRLNNRIDELLDMARGETGTLELVCSETDILELLQSVATDVSVLASTRRQALVVDLPPCLPLAWADDARVKQVLLNLLGNALKFTPDGGTVAIRAREEGDGVVVEVEDSGPGIPGEQQKLLFQPYRRLGNGTKRSGGLGLGLALSKTLVELHGGRIWVKSTEGEGSIFCFSLPSHSPAPSVP
jgi:PAS domain S-box-containing protein